VGAEWRLAAPAPSPGRKETVEVRLVPGLDWEMIFKRFGPGGGVRAVESRRFQLSAKSDRMGLRLTGEPFILPGGAGEQVSRPVVPGTVQLPPDGQPIVLMAEGQTIGGYPQLGQVASVDLPRLAQARPGAEIVFKMTDVSAAQQARLRVAADLNKLRVGLTMCR
jgi:allophanate hydrolase subunit 2